VKLEDDALVLRPLSADDAAAVTEACQDPDMHRWLPALPVPYMQEDARAFIGSVPDASAISDAITDEFLGCISWREVDQGNVQIGYWVKREARGRGVATRALRLLGRWALEEHGAPRAQLLAEPGNVASCRVAEKAGFTREALLRRYLGFKGERRDVLMYSLLPEDLTEP
jgi:RimJ/RimL family protein N-acetyltransferase